MNFEVIKNNQQKPGVGETELLKKEDAENNSNKLGELKQKDKEMSSREIELIKKDLTFAGNDENTLRSIEKSEANASDLFDKNKLGNSTVGILHKIRNNKLVRRAIFASTLVGGMFLSDKLSAQTENNSDNIIKTELRENNLNKQFNIEKNQEKIKQEFFSLLNKIGDYSDKYPDSDFMEQWNPSKSSVNYYKDDFLVPKKNNESEYNGEGVEKYNISFTKNKGNLVNFDIVKLDNDINTWIRYNELSSMNVIALRFSLKKQPGFQKMTAHEFESTYTILETSGGGGKDKNHYYVWVDNNLNEEEELSKTLFNFNDQSIYPDYADKVFGFKK